MEKLDEYTPEKLQNCSYRYLQQTAKGLGLPSNVKKLCLIHLIYVKKHYSEEQCEKLVNQVRLERKQTSLSRKRAKEKRKNMSKTAQQISEITSTIRTTSPPITSTPIPIGHITIRYSPEPHSPKKRINRGIASNTTINVSDRVLRSYSGVRKPRYIFNNKILNIINGSSEKYKSVNNLYNYRQVNSGLVVKKKHWKNGNEIVPVRTHRSTNTSPQIISNHNHVPRRLSGIYPLYEETTAEKYIGIRRPDGTIAKINTYVPKPLPSKEIENNISQLLTLDSAETVTTVSNMIEKYRGVEIVVTENSSDNPSMAMTSYKENTIHYHKKIRTEQMRSFMSRCISNECQLPKINAVFNNFNSWNVRDVTQPIYVQVSNESEIVLKDPVIQEVHSNELNILENIYNLKNTFIVNQPLAQVTTTTNTHCTYATSIVSTPKAQTSTSVSSLYNNALLVDSSTHDVGDPRVTEFFRNYRCNEATFDTVDSQCSSESPQSQNANITIPEMVEDAFEVISQDGDYMERMGMDIVMQCIFCEWAGPKMVLEFHIRKDHSSEIISLECCEWHATYSLGTLTTDRSWHNKVLDRASKLYVLSTKYDDPDYFCVLITTLSSAFENPTSGSITTYNKVTGEPFIWKGLIPELPPNLTYDYDSNCLKLQLSKLDLLPNSANIQLLNRELVVKSPGKVVVGQPELHNIHITVIVKLDDCDCHKY